jgi:hypothetical protein
MKTFMAIYLGSDAARARWDALDEQTRGAREKAGMQGWMQWGSDNASAVVENGSPLGRTKRVDRAGVADVRNAMAAWTIVRADSHEAAAQLFVDHPHFTIFPGEAVEIMECLPIPQM